MKWALSLRNPPVRWSTSEHVIYDTDSVVEAGVLLQEELRHRFGTVANVASFAFVRLSQSAIGLKGPHIGLALVGRRLKTVDRPLVILRGLLVRTL